jgi:hypothetical protein
MAVSLTTLTSSVFERGCSAVRSSEQGFESSLRTRSVNIGISGMVERVNVFDSIVEKRANYQDARVKGMQE